MAPVAYIYILQNTKVFSILFYLHEGVSVTLNCLSDELGASLNISVLPQPKDIF